MARKAPLDASLWPSLNLEGVLIAPAKLSEIAAPEQKEETRRSYGLRRGLTLRDEISTAFRVGQAHFDDFVKFSDPSATATQRFVKDLLKEAFGFWDLEPGEGAAAFLAGGRVPVVVVPPAEEKLDRRSPTLSTEGKALSPALALQDLLNAEEGGPLGLGDEWSPSAPSARRRLADAPLLDRG